MVGEWAGFLPREGSTEFLIITRETFMSVELFRSDLFRKQLEGGDGGEERMTSL
jgi:hypothetical protein